MFKCWNLSTCQRAVLYWAVLYPPITNYDKQMTTKKTVCLVCRQRFFARLSLRPEIVVLFYSLILFRPMFARLDFLVFIWSSEAGRVGNDPWLGSVMSRYRKLSLHYDIWITLFTACGAGTDTDSSFPSSSLLPAPQSAEVLFWLLVCVYLSTFYYHETTSSQLFWFTCVLA